MTTPETQGHPAQSLVGLVFNLERRVRTYMEGVLGPLGISPPEWSVIFHVWRSGPHSSAELARRVFVTPQAAGQIIGELEGKGIVVRHPDPDHGRKRMTFLTPSGRELAERCQERIEHVEEHVLSSLQPREREFFTALLAECVDYIAVHPLPDATLASRS